MKGPRGGEEGRQCSLPGVGGGLLLHPSCPTKERGLKNTARASPSWPSVSERTPPCDLIPAQTVGQEGSCDTHFPCTKTGEKGDTPQAEVRQPEYKVTCVGTSALNGPPRGGPCPQVTSGPSRGHLGQWSSKSGTDKLRLVSSCCPRGGPRRALPILWSPQKQNKRKRATSHQYTLRSDLGNTCQTGRREHTRLPQRFVGHLCSLPAPHGRL